MIWLLRFVPESYELKRGTSNSQSVARSDCDLEVYSCKMIRVRLNTPGVEEPVSIKRKGECKGLKWTHSWSRFRTSSQPNSRSSSTNTKRQKGAVTHSEPILDSSALEEYRIHVGGA